MLVRNTTAWAVRITWGRASEPYLAGYGWFKGLGAETYPQAIKLFPTRQAARDAIKGRDWEPRWHCPVKVQVTVKEIK